MNSGTCRRLENLFWRIWGSHRPILSRNECHNAVSKLHGRSLRVQGQTLAELFWRIDASRLDEQLVVKKIKKTTTAPVVSRSVESAIILDDEEKSAISQNTGIDLPAQILHHAVCLPKRKKRVSFQDRCDTVYIQDWQGDQGQVILSWLFVCDLFHSIRESCSWAFYGYNRQLIYTSNSMLLDILLKCSK